MLRIVSDNSEVERLLHRLHQAVAEYGGWISPGLEVVCADGDFSIRSDMETEVTGTIIRMPEACLPSLKDFTLGIDDDEIVIISHADAVRTEHVTLIQLLIAIYNCTEKLVLHRRVSPWFTLARWPAILEHVVRGREKAAQVQKFRKYYENGRLDDLLLESFIATRKFPFRASGSQAIRPVLMPFVEFLNHHWSSPRFRVIGKEMNGFDGISVEHSRPIIGSDECFVCYGNSDTLDCYVIFNFSDLSVPFVRSIPLVVSLSGVGSMHIFSQNMQTHTGALPAAMEDIRFYIPEDLGVRDDAFAISHVIVPGKNAHTTLRRTLEYVIHRANPDILSATLRDGVITAEKSIIGKNIAYYRMLNRLVSSVGEDLASSDVLGALKDLCNFQMSKLHGYADLIGLDT
jgi:hypothetical protein